MFNAGNGRFNIADTECIKNVNVRFVQSVKYRREKVSMEFWFSELHSPHVKFDIRVEKQLFTVYWRERLSENRCISVARVRKIPDT